MNVSLTPELEKLVNQKVSSGMYNSASEVIREGLRLLQEQDELKNLRRDVLLGVEQIRQGKGRQYAAGTELTDKIKRRAGKRLEAERKGAK